MSEANAARNRNWLGRLFGGLQNARQPTIAAPSASAESEAAFRTAIDRLTRERDELRVALQQATRLGGLPTPGAAERYPAKPFPGAILPDGGLPYIEIVDIGAQILDMEDHIYSPLVTAGIARTTGFEPIAAEADRRSAAEPGVRMLNHFVGTGERRQFHINQWNPTSSLYPPNLDFLRRFDGLAEICTPAEIIEVETTRLDDIAAVADCDYLKLDIQGGELDVLRHAGRVLPQVVAVHTELEFVPVYSGQPLFGEVDSFLRDSGFELVDILNAGYATTKALPRPIARSRLLWGEGVYMRSPDSFARLSVAKIVKAAVIAHVNYRMYDIAASFLAVADRVHGTQLLEPYGREVVDDPV